MYACAIGSELSEVRLFILRINHRNLYLCKFLLYHYIGINYSLIPLGSCDSVVSIATGYGLYYRGVGVRVPVGSRIFSSPHRPDRLWGPPNLLSNGYQEREADHSPPASAEVKKMWIYTSIPPYTFMA
jgi:hypothetical protein